MQATAAWEFACPDIPAYLRPIRGLLGYRHAIEELARGSGQPEVAVAERLVERAARHRRSERAADPGYHLVARGRFAFERDLGFNVSPRLRLLRLYVRSASISYPATIVALSAAVRSLSCSW